MSKRTANPHGPLPGRLRTASQPSAILASTESLLLVATAIATAGLLFFKAYLVHRLNINWDEFFYLNHVHAVARGDGGPLLQRFQTHLFAWLTRLEGDEIAQILAARAVMVALLALTTFLVWRLGRTWLQGWPAAIPPLVYVSAVPVMTHGGSFRADSMLAPLTVLALVLLFRPDRRRSHEILAGCALGLAGAITIKVALAAPLVFAAIVFRPRADNRMPWPGLADAGSSTLRVGAAAAVAFVVLIGVHWLLVGQTSMDPSVALGTASAKKTLLDTPLYRQGRYFVDYVRWQPLPWLLMLTGVVLAIARRRLDVASLALALLPVVIYRNAFPYYYVVMLAPASVLAGFAVQELRGALSQRPANWIVTAVTAIIGIGLLYQALAYHGRLMVDQQWNQEQLIAAVHQVFPEPVNYVDRCGMVSSFRKVNFFMSTWGMDTYRERGEPFMAAAIREHRPAFVLVNSSALNPNRRIDTGLLPEDYDLIARYYPKYWGPLRVAGASAVVDDGAPVRLRVPFPASYRVWSSRPVLIDGVERASGDAVDVPEQGVSVSLAPRADDAAPAKLRLFLASARPAPEEQLPGLPLFTGL